MGEGSSVLIVEPSAEVREVLRTALERRGLRIYEASWAQGGLELARQHRPDLVVLDVDEQSGDADTLSGELWPAGDAAATPVILLGTVRRGTWPEAEFIAKPYHYQPLISRIEQLLKAPRGQVAKRRAA